MASLSNRSYRMIAHIFWYIGRVARSSVQDLLWLILSSFGFCDPLSLQNGDLTHSCGTTLVLTIE
jgi:hypothetical protein